MLELAKNNFLKDPRCVFLTDGESLPTNHFDLIVFSSVLMTISSKRKLEKVVQKMRKCAVDRGQCLVADRVLRPEVAYRFVEGDQGEGVPVGLLKAKAAIVFNTANTPDARERKVFGDPLETLWKNCVFGLCGVKNVYRRTFSVVVTSTPRQRADWLVEVRKTVERIFPGRE